MNKCLILLFLFFIGLERSHAQKQIPLKYYLTDDSSSFIGFRAITQVWLRYAELNEGTQINGELKDSFFDVSVRRVRLQAYATINRTQVNISLGQNNINYQNATAGALRLLDLYITHQLTPWLTLGAGESAWNGLSRYAAPHTSFILTLDIPMVSIPTVNLTDNILRKLGGFAYGQWNKWDYRIVFSRPYAALAQNPKEGKATFARGVPGVQTAGYLKYFIQGKESQASPFHPFTYLGKQKRLIVGIGIEYQPSAMWSLKNSDTLSHPICLLASDIFGEFPLTSRLFLTAYGSFMHYNFGPDFIRLIGVNNIADVEKNNTSFSGWGNKYPAVGTGQTAYGQWGIGWKPFTNSALLIQPFLSEQFSSFDLLDDKVWVGEYGFHVLFKEQKSKISFALQDRPIFESQIVDQINKIDRKQSFVFQYQVRIE